MDDPRKIATPGSLDAQIKQKMFADELATYTRARIAEELAQSTRAIADRLVISTADIADRLAATEANIAKKLEQQYDVLRHDWYAKQLIWNQVIVGLIGIIIALVVWLLFA